MKKSIMKFVSKDKESREVGSKVTSRIVAHIK
jgi:hypothetical protein